VGSIFIEFCRLLSVHYGYDFEMGRGMIALNSIDFSFQWMNSFFHTIDLPV
jgi:hypothetical protein